MYERSKEKGSVWVTLKRSSVKNKAKHKKMETEGEAIEYRCLVCATDGKKPSPLRMIFGKGFAPALIARTAWLACGFFCKAFEEIVLSAKDHQKFQAFYAMVLKARMNALKKRERRDKKRTAEVQQKPGSSKKAISPKKPKPAKPPL